MQRSKYLLAAAGVLATTALLAGCAPGAAAGSSTGSEPVSTDLGSAKVTLNLISTPESGAATKATIAGFEKLHPNITVKYSQTNYNDYNKSVNLALASKEAPDIALLNAVANTVKDKLVLDLDPYAKAYNWSTVFPSNELDQWRVASDGSTLGSGGALYAAPAGFSIVGLYYNKKIATQLGIDSAPKTLDALEADMAKAKAAGQVPLQLGNSQGHASFILQSIGQSIEGAPTANKWVFGDKGNDFNTPGNVTGATKLSEWAKDGYFPTSANGTDLQGAVNNFISGQGLFFVDGNWDAATIDKGLGSDAGFTYFPGAKATGIGTSVAYAISSKSRNPNAAAAFLNYLHSKNASKQQFAQGFMPDDPTAANPTPGSLQADIVAAWAAVAEDNGLVGFNNNATATMNDTLTSSTQELIAAKTTVPQFISMIQTDWVQTHGKG